MIIKTLIYNVGGLITKSTISALSSAYAYIAGPTILRSINKSLVKVCKESGIIDDSQCDTYNNYMHQAVSDLIKAVVPEPEPTPVYSDIINGISIFITGAVLVQKIYEYIKGVQQFIPSTEHTSRVNITDESIDKEILNLYQSISNVNTRDQNAIKDRALIMKCASVEEAYEKSLMAIEETQSKIDHALGNSEVHSMVNNLHVALLGIDNALDLVNEL